MTVPVEITFQGRALPKCPTGIRGLDEITFGGLPRGRTTLVCGGAGCGKTLLGMEFLVRGAVEHGEPGVCISFEENADELASNVASLGFDVKDLVARKLLTIDYVLIERHMILDTGEYDLEGLFIRLNVAVERVGARRVLVDSVESLFAGLPNEAILRAELRRLFRWLKDKSLTAVVTGERGRDTLTRYGLEEYISDCVIALDNRVADAVSTRRLRVVKYRGSTHGSNEYPFLIDHQGISVLPVTSLELKHSVSRERISTGVAELDRMLGGAGFYRGSTVLVSGTTGTGKTSLATALVNSACARGERCTFFSFEESPEQLLRNMESVGFHLRQWVDKGVLTFHTVRPTTFGLETHLLRMHQHVQEFSPSVVVIDPVTALLHTGSQVETGSMLLRLIDHLKASGITSILVALVSGLAEDKNSVDISSLVDAWLLLREIESGGERNRGLYVLKARGLAHSNQIREFTLSSSGIRIREPYMGADRLVTGSARVTEEAEHASVAQAAEQELLRRRLASEQKRKAIEAQIAALQLEAEIQAAELEQFEIQRRGRLAKSDAEAGALVASKLEVPEVGHES